MLGLPASEPGVSLPDDRRKLVTRLIVVQYLVIVAFVALALAFWYFQIVQHQKFSEMAENNHQRNLGLRAPRGVLFDRSGRVLVENRDSLRHLHRPRAHPRHQPARAGCCRRCSASTRRSCATPSTSTAAEPSYRPIPIVQDATLAQVAAVTAHRLDTELPDVIVERVPTRRYPESMAAHLFGYVAQATEAQLARDGLPVAATWWGRPASSTSTTRC